MRDADYHVWTDADIYLLRKEAALKKTAAQIAENWPRVSRNGVISQCKKHCIKLMWTRRNIKKNPNPGQHGPLSINFEKKYRALLPEPFAVAAPISLFSHKECLCVWVVGNPKLMHVCGSPAVDGRPYCPDHERIAHEGVE